MIHLLRCSQPQPLWTERDAVAGGLLLSGQVNHRNRMENGSSKNKTLVYVGVCNQQAPACVSAGSLAHPPRREREKKWKYVRGWLAM